jgi:hypothetical protein
MEAAITALINLYEVPQVLDDDELRKQLSDVIRRLRQHITALEEGPKAAVGGAGAPARAESPCPCGTCD